jgi:hypothetical protein
MIKALPYYYSKNHLSVGLTYPLLAGTCRHGIADLIALRRRAGFIDLFGIQEIGLTNNLRLRTPRTQIK